MAQQKHNRISAVRIIAIVRYRILTGRGAGAQTIPHGIVPAAKIVPFRRRIRHLVDDPVFDSFEQGIGKGVWQGEAGGLWLT
jgi:hypothetical protein